MKIKILPKDVISKISAGEVVERPSSVVKELVENSLDAKASFIRIELEDAGLTKIMVTDDGEGMVKDDLVISVKPHTTSKLNNNDIHEIKHLGFRGEALSSIASISKLEIKSKANRSNKGAFLEIINSREQNISFVGMPTGTSVVVKDLFSNVPVRKKFLRRQTTELKKITDVVTKLALAHPKTGFILSHNGKVIIELRENQKKKDRIRDLLGEDFYFHLMPIKVNGESIELSGYIGTPQISTKSSHRQFLFVNNRPVESNLISSVVKEAYGSLLDPRAYPAFILFIEILPSLIDVNIHPRKEEVKFINKENIAQLLENSIKATLNKYDLTFRKRSTFKTADLQTAFLLKEETTPWSVRKFSKSEVLQIHDTYLVMQSDEGMMILDQHAAHERILYEQFLEKFETRKKDTFKLKKPVLFELPVSEAVILEESLDILKKLGFSMEDFGKRSFKVSSVPEIFKTRDIFGLISEFVSDLAMEKKPDSLDEKSRLTISYLSCRSAIKAGDKLSKKERESLIKKLSKTKTNYTCPHGRPVRVEIPKDELERMFKRR